MAEVFLIRHTIIYFLIRAGNGLLTIASLAVFTRMLTPEEYGLYSLTLAAATITAAIFFQWQNVAVGRFYPIYSNKPRLILLAANFGYWVASFVVIVLSGMALIVRSWWGISPFIIILVCLLAILMGRYNLLLQLANIASAPGRYALLSWSRGGVALLLGAGLICCGAKATGVLVASLVGLSVSILLFSPIPGSRMPWRIGEFEKTKEIFKYGFPLTFTFIALMIVGLADRLLIGWFSNIKDAGFYGASYDFVQFTIGACMNVLFMAGFPRTVVAFEQENIQSAYIKLNAMGRALVVVGMPVSLIITFLSKDIARLLFGISIQTEASRIMPWLAIAMFVAGIKSYYLDAIFQLHKKSKPIAHIAITMAVVNILMNLLLLPRFGALGAAWATLGAFTIGAVMSCIMGKSIMKPKISIKELAGISISCIAMIAVLMTMQGLSGLCWFGVKVATGVSIYLGVYVLMNFRSSSSILIGYWRSKTSMR